MYTALPDNRILTDSWVAYSRASGMPMMDVKVLEQYLARSSAELAVLPSRVEYRLEQFSRMAAKAVTSEI
ncbi:uncharacterized protein A1O9_01910 [Exophiala aquamarina CBS 119918]|uniref:Uncharacterized protein n=1 Tax=Exophiala aquamarina CBS 119918 TaxID=1182545 RepID=A0A072PXN4_9EURO|nr:uncharacterized protein A1O9_01910 [Exophiala aquamarina CBS 119918]KEF60350.1 hypothetical protein A1O9_01910 [Exophiala aquamarina CBS 119918]